MSNETDKEKALRGNLERLKKELGPVVMRGLEDPKVVEVMVNPDGKIIYDVMGEGMTHVGDMQPMNIILALRSISFIMGKEMNAENPQLECELPIDGSRFAGSIPPTAKQAFFAIRKRASLVFTLDDYVAQGILSPRYAEVLKNAISSRKNILIVGGTGSGKTTFTNAILAEIARVADMKQRIVIIEDTPELQCAAENKVELLTSPTVTMNDLLRHTLRLRPDRIVVGETRGKEALALLKAWNTGHPGGAATVHANDAMAGLIRLEQLIQEAGVPPQPQLIAEAVNLVVFITKTTKGREISEIIEVQGFDNKEQKYLTTLMA